ncbi:MAG: hypothetical protein NVSMB14_01500 [Isosphaeraceae bacterium]
MANATVEQLKDVGLKYGEKIGLGVAGAVCLFFIGQAVANKPLEMTPQQIEEAAKAAESNLNRSESEAQIAAKLADDDKVKLKIPDLAARVAKNDQAKLATNEDSGAKFGSFHPWVVTEPGAGKIRELPPLGDLVIHDIEAASNRGGPVLFARDEKGDRKYASADDEKTEDKPKARRGPKRKKPPATDQTKIDQENLQKRLNAEAIAKGEEPPVAEEKKEEPKPEADPAAKGLEALVGKRWVAIVGTVDNKKLRDAWMKALKVDLESAYPDYKRVDLERKQLQDNGQWSDWTPVDREKNELVQLDITESEQELVPEKMILPTLVDRLSFLKVGYWRGVHIAKLVPEDFKKPKPEKETAASEEDAGGGYSEANMGPDYSKMMGQTAKARSTSGYGPAGSSPGGAGATGAENTGFPHSDSPTLMIRSLDFTVEPGAVYQYRARLVVANPNLNRDDVMPGTDVTTKELKGVWSEVPDPVRIPNDVSAYVAKVSSAGNEKLQFEVAVWNPDDGQTLVKDFDAGPGQVIGGRASPIVPNYEGKESKPKSIDFTSKILVLDTEGGPNGIADLGLSGTEFEVPARALVLNSNGSLTFYSQAKDAVDPEMKNMEETYKLALKEAQKKKPRKTEGMGGYGGMMGGGGGGGSGGGGGYGGGRR